MNDMTDDMTSIIQPKSDQLNSDSLLTGPITITITKVELRPGTEQPISVFFEGDGDKPWKPCKSMAKVMTHCWGRYASQYIGRSMTLYCDPKVTWGGMAVGGIRISHMTDINDTQVMALTATKGSKKPFTVKPLVVSAPVATNTKDDPEDLKLANDLVAIFGESKDAADHLELVEVNQAQTAWLKENAPRLWKTRVEPAIKASYERHVAGDPPNMEGEAEASDEVEPV